jgi:hypothetical protein
MIELSIEMFGWFPFGKKEFECAGLSEETMEFYMKNDELPNPCNDCYKALIFWDGKYSNENTMNFFKMLDSFEVDYRGKLNSGVVVFYFREKDTMLGFLKYLNDKLTEFNVKGRVQWRRACKKFQGKS